MLTNKFKFLVFIVVIAVIALGVTSFLAMKSIEDAKAENEAAKLQIEELNNSLKTLQSALKDTDNELADHEDRIKKYQDILSAWTKATPNVNEAVNRIVVAYEDIAKNSHLFPAEKLEGLEDAMMDAVYGAIRSTDPLSIAKEFENKTGKLNEIRYDNIINDKIEKIKQNGVTFPEDKTATTELVAYYNGFLDDKAVMDSFKSQEIDKEIANLVAQLDSDEEKDLASVFEKEVAAIKTPILPTTSLTKANDAWNALASALEPDDKLTESTQKALVLLETYTVRKNQLIDLVNAIRKEIDRIHTADPNVTHDEIKALDTQVDKLLSLDVTIEVLNTDSKNYVTLLKEARLLPFKNDAFAQIRASYDAYCLKAKNDRSILIKLVAVKDEALNSVEKATSTNEINRIIENTKEAFEKCLK